MTFSLDYMQQTFRPITGALLGALIAVSSTSVMASTVNGGSLLSSSDADQLETWLGVGPQDFTNIWSGGIGATAASFHAAADDAGPTISIYSITHNQLGNMRIGGYTTQSWGSDFAIYKSDPDAFIFNLDSGEIQRPTGVYNDLYAILAYEDYFPTFGGGHDLYGGRVTLGGSTPYSYSYTYDTSQGQITVAGDSGAYQGDSGYSYYGWSVNSLEVYTFQSASTVVPLPSALPLLAGALGIVGFMGWRRKRSVA
ncbi:MAG: PEP_CTERM-anchored TLD domain-containing protein [Roseibium sp.]|uniref:PEP_CTERM-anchored TLD domain-containing protein n=1 Tax=Roseibium sp. TaxID=1936156 RepID=UPI003D9C149F